MIIGKGVNPVISKSVHRKIGFPVTIFVTRHAAGIGAKPFVTILIDTDSEYIFVGQSVVTSKGINELVIA